MFENQKTISSQEHRLIPEHMWGPMPFQHLSFPQGPHICQPEYLHIFTDSNSRKDRFIKKEKPIAKRENGPSV